MKKTIAMLLAVLMVVGMFSGCQKQPVATDPTKPSESTPVPSQSTEPSTEPVVKTYTYNDSVSTMATNWNTHTYQTTDDSYPIDFMASGLYRFIYNDELNPIEGKDPYTGYVIVPELAAGMPVDVTEKVKTEHPEFNIPESENSGFAYTIALNPDAMFSNGKKINAETYVESVKRLLDPKLQNYRATDIASLSNSFALAGADAYSKGGVMSYEVNSADGENLLFSLADLTKGDDGQYVNADGQKVFIAPSTGLAWLAGDSLEFYVDYYGEAMFDIASFSALLEKANAKGMVPLTDETLDLITKVITFSADWGESVDHVPYYLTYGVENEVTDWSTVGIYASGEYELTIVLAKSLSGFYLLYSIGSLSNALVDCDLYDSCLKESNGVWTSTYGTSVETTVSTGPYIMTSYQTDKQMVFEVNENWFGWTDGKHVYVDPADGETYQMYQTTKIITDVVPEATTRLQMFLKGQLIGYGLQTEDMDTYRTSDYAYVTPGSTIFFLILSGHKSMLSEREQAADFNAETHDLQTISVQSFRKAMALVYDRQDFCNTVQPSRNPGLALLGTGYISNPDTGEQYRDTDAAKQALCDFYSVDVSKYASLDEAVKSITGYDPETAKTLFAQAFQDSLDAGYITDADGDGKCDQQINITYSVSSESDFQTKLLNYMNTKLTEVLVGTPFEGKVAFVGSAPLGNDWSTQLKNGQTDTCLAGWNGSQMDPYGLLTAYTDPSSAYNGQWWAASAVNMTYTIDGKEVTMSIKDWADCLNGSVMEVDGVAYNFGFEKVDYEVRLGIMAAIENAILQTYDYIPMIQDGSMSLLSQKVFYVVEEYNPVMGRGGIAYMKYNYSDAEWDAYVAECGGTLTY